MHRTSKNIYNALNFISPSDLMKFSCGWMKPSLITTNVLFLRIYKVLNDTTEWEIYTKRYSQPETWNYSWKLYNEGHTQGTFLAFIINNTNKTIKLKQGSKIGKVEPIRECDCINISNYSRPKKGISPKLNSFTEVKKILILFIDFRT